MTDDIAIGARRGKVAHLTMNRPGSHNSLFMAVLERMNSAIIEHRIAHNLHVIVINANGSGFFAGLDLKRQTSAHARLIKAGSSLKTPWPNVQV